MTLEELLKLLEQAGGSAGPVTAAPATAASAPAKPAAASGVPGLTPSAGLLSTDLMSIGAGTEFGNLVDPLFGINAGSASSTGGEVGGGVGALIGLLFGPLGSALGGLGGGFLGDLLGGWIGGGIPRSAKSGAIGTALESSGNPLDALIGQYVGKGVAQGDVLSESGPSSFETDVDRFAAMVEALTGLQAPGVTATGFQHNPTWQNPAMARAIQGFQLPPGYEFVNDPSKLADVYKDIASKIGISASNVYGKAGQRDWTSVVQELISQGALTKYGGPMGAAGAQNTSAGAIPNISLPHPLAQNQPQLTPPPYPV